MLAAQYSASDKHLCFQYIDSTICLLPKSEISRLGASSVVVHLHLHLYLDPSLIDYYSTGLTSGGNARKDKNKDNIGSKK